LKRYPRVAARKSARDFNLDDVRTLVQGLSREGVREEFVKESLVFTGEGSPMVNLMLSIMGAFAESELSD
jgi:DNA invertase Pin-like site-specific DNA recombinase